MTDKLPEGWATATLNELCAVITDGTHQTPSYVTEGVPFISTANLRPFSIGFDFTQYRRFISAREHSTLTRRCTPDKGDILLSKCGTIGRVKEVDVDFPFSIFVGLALLKPHRGVFSSKFAEFWLNCPYVKAQFDENSPGSTRRTLTLKGIKPVVIPIPPIAEQKRLVEKLEKLLAEVEQCKERMAKIPVLLKRFRQSVLAAACSGRLTADWREEQPSANGTTEVSDDLPDGWQVTSVGDVIADLKYGTSQRCSREKSGTPVLRIPNIGDGVVDRTDLKYADLPDRELGRLALVPGDILVIRSNGSVSLVGKSAMVREPEKGFAYAGYLIRLRVKRNVVLPEFLNLSLGSHAVRLQIEVPARSTSGVNNINSDEVRSLKVFLPPVAEQDEIVRRVGKLFALADRIDERYRTAKKQVDSLTQSILAKAFRGDLVPTEAELAEAEGRSFESAEGLLRKIGRREIATEQDESQQSPGRGRKQSPRPARSTGRTTPVK